MDIQKLYLQANEVDKKTGRIILPSSEELVKINRRPRVTSLSLSPEYLPPLDSNPAEIPGKQPEPKMLISPPKSIKEASLKSPSVPKVDAQTSAFSKRAVNETAPRNNMSPAWLAALACSILLAVLSAYLIVQNSNLNREIYTLEQSKPRPEAPMPVITTVKLEAAEYQQAIITLSDEITTLSDEVRELNHFMKSFDYVTETEGEYVTEVAPVDATQQATDDHLGTPAEIRIKFK
jgi:hypothetical protein